MNNLTNTLQTAASGTRALIGAILPSRSVMALGAILALFLAPLIILAQSVGA